MSNKALRGCCHEASEGMCGSKGIERSLTNSGMDIYLELPELRVPAYIEREA